MSHLTARGQPCGRRDGHPGQHYSPEAWKARHTRDLEYKQLPAVKEMRREYGREYQREYMPEYRRRHPYRRPAYHRHHLTPEQFEALKRKQGDLCRCGLPLGEQVVIDHDHGCCPGVFSCGKCVRGILHPNCNKVIGFAEDDPKRLRSLAEYLEAT